METYETEDQQVEAIKTWWRDNFKFVIILSIATIGGILGSQYYQENKIIMAETASDTFNVIVLAADNKQIDIVADRTQLLQKDYQSSPYTSQATLLWAKNLATTGSKEQAMEKLLWVEKNSSDSSLQQIAIIQRAQLLASTGKAEQALKLLQGIAEESAFTAVSLEVKGDILASGGQQEQAKKAYDEAIGKFILVGARVDILRIKRNDLGN